MAVPSDPELLKVAEKIKQDQDQYWNIGLNLGFTLNYLEELLDKSKDDKHRATLKVLTRWRDLTIQKGITDATSVLALALEDLKMMDARDQLAPTSLEAKPWTVEVASTEASFSVGKSSNDKKFTPSELETQSTISQVTTADSRGGESESSKFPSSKGKESKFDKGSAQSDLHSSSIPKAGSSSGLTNDVGHMSLDPQRDQVDPARHTHDWLQKNRDAEEAMRGALGGDAMSGMSECSKTTLTLRDYQVELAKPALEGHNTIVVSPTGSGKTWVAVAVAQSVLAKSEGKAKIIFVVNQVPLVHQQSTVFKKFMDRVTYVCGDHGHAPMARLPLNILLRENDVVVLTAQILVDALDSKQVLLQDIGLIIFDECHEAKRASQYNGIMGIYMEQKHQNQLPLPQILGMTASLGVGGASMAKDAMRYILKVCANLDVVKISTVQDHKESLAQVENKPEENSHIVYGRKDDAFGEEIQRMMLEILTMINNSSAGGASAISSVVEKLSTLRSSNHSQDNFSHVLCDLKKKIVDPHRSGDEQRSLLTCTEHLKEYSTCLSIHETARTKDALLNLQDYIEQQELKEPNLTQTDRFLLQIFKDRYVKLQHLSESPDCANPGLKKLQSLLEEACVSSDGGPGSFRGILFTQTIASTKALKAWVMETDSIKWLNPEVLVGCRNPGMTMQHQTDVLSRFLHGNHKLLIATSVIQQGIDVPSCNFVFRYNYISDAVGRIQARGRTRAPGGRFELVVHQYRRLHEKDQLGIEQEQLMKQVTEQLSKLTVEEMRQKLNTVQTDIKKGTVSNNDSSKPEGGAQNKFYCSRCQEFACDAGGMRVVHGGHHVIVDRQILGRTKRPPKKAARTRNENRKWKKIELGEHDVCCKKCEEKWGSVLRCTHGTLIAVSLRYLHLKTNSELKTYKSWGKLPFCFREANLQDAVLREDSSDEPMMQ